MDNGTFQIEGSSVVLGTFPYILTKPPTGVLGTPRIRTDDRDIPLRHGVIPGDDFKGGREMGFEGVVLGSTPAEAEERAVALEAAFDPRALDVNLLGRLSGSPSEYLWRGRRRGSDILLDWILFENGQASVPYRCQFLATDPIRYSATLTSVNFSMPSPAGTVLPVTLPFYLGAGSPTSVVLPAGSTAVDWTATFTGPLTLPVILEGTTGRRVRVATTLAGGQVAVVDSRRGVVTLNGVPQPTWWDPANEVFQLEPPPSANSVYFTANAGTGTMQLAYRAGWT